MFHFYFRPCVKRRVLPKLKVLPNYRCPKFVSLATADTVHVYIPVQKGFLIQLFLIQQPPLLAFAIFNFVVSARGCPAMNQSDMSAIIGRFIIH